MKTKLEYTVESGEERWNYDSHIPTREVVDYWVRFGREVVKKFTFREDAEKYAAKLNKAVSSVS